MIFPDDVIAAISTSFNLGHSSSKLYKVDWMKIPLQDPGRMIVTFTLDHKPWQNWLTLLGKYYCLSVMGLELANPQL